MVHTDKETLSEVKTRHLATQCNVKADALLDTLTDIKEEVDGNTFGITLSDVKA